MNRQVDIPDSVAFGTQFEVLKRQSTYWDIAVRPGGMRCRIHFLKKAEFEFCAGPASAISIRPSHPLLVEYEEPQDALYISTTPSDPSGTLVALHDLCDRQFDGWRPLTRYLNDLASPEELLSGGHGLLLRGPRSFVAASAEVLANFGVETQLFRGTGPRGTFQVLELGRSYVVAESFEFEPFGAV